MGSAKPATEGRANTGHFEEREICPLPMALSSRRKRTGYNAVDVADTKTTFWISDSFRKGDVFAACTANLAICL